VRWPSIADHVVISSGQAVVKRHPTCPTGRAVASAGVDEFVGVGRLSRLTVDAARAAGLGEAHHATTFEDTVAHLLKRVAPNDVVLVKGSRGMRMERVVDALVARLAR